MHFLQKFVQRVYYHPALNNNGNLKIAKFPDIEPPKQRSFNPG